MKLFWVMAELEKSLLLILIIFVLKEHETAQENVQSVFLSFNKPKFRRAEGI